MSHFWAQEFQQDNFRIQRMHVVEMRTVREGRIMITQAYQIV